MGQVVCPAFATFNTAGATKNTVSCQIIACQGRTVRLSLCPQDSMNFATCAGDTYLRVNDANGVQIASNDNYCGSCSGLTFTASSQCSIYTIIQGCAGTGACSGTTAVTFYDSALPLKA